MAQIKNYTKQTTFRRAHLNDRSFEIQQPKKGTTLS